MHDQATRMRELAKNFRRQHQTVPLLVTITSGKGGVGKSTIALNTAIALGAAGRKVLLVDADANLGSLDVMLGLAPRFRMGHVLRGEKQLEEVLLAPYPGVKVLPASSGEVQHPAMQGETHEWLVNQLLGTDERFDVVLVDTGAGLHESVLAYARRANEVLVVSGPEPTSVMDAYAMMKVLWADRAEASVRLVLNAVKSPTEAQEVEEKLRLAVGHFLRRELDVLGVVPKDEHAALAVARQQPVVKSFPRSAAATALQALAGQLANRCLQMSERRAQSL